jgi:prevent-host-death family protein
MTSVGSFAAKTHLSTLLKRVQKGERILITKRGRPVAMLTPPPAPKHNVGKIVEQMKALRRGNRLAGATIRELIEDGRRL